jgi:PST family polysaccharide transporter
MTETSASLTTVCDPLEATFVAKAAEHARSAPQGEAPALASNLFYLYIVHLFNYMVPVVTIPFLARMLGPAQWGEYAFVESVSRYLSLFVEYGFALSATREVARCRGNAGRRSELLAGVLGAQLCLAMAGMAIVMFWALGSARFRSHAALFTAGCFWAVFEGMSLMWYYQALERSRSIAIVDVITKSCAVVAMYWCVHQPADAWKVLALRGGAAGFSLCIGLAIAYTEIPFQFPTPKLIGFSIRNGATMFLFRSSTALSTVANVIVLGLVARPEIVGFYAGAEKISKASIGLLSPITQALYPRIANTLDLHPGSASRFARLGFLLMAGGGLALGITLYVMAPWLVRLFLGKGYESATAVLRILALLHPIIAMNNMLGIQWMLPLRLDRAFNAITLCGGVLNVTLAAVLAHRLAQTGPAWAIVIAQTAVLIAIVATLNTGKLLPSQQAHR